MRRGFLALLAVGLACLACLATCDDPVGPPHALDPEEPEEESEFSVSIEEDGDRSAAVKIVSAPDLSKEREAKGDAGEAKADEQSLNLLMLRQAKWLKQMVQDLGGVQYTIVANEKELEVSLEEEEDEAALAELAPAQAKELSPEEEKAKQIYESAVAILNKTKPDKVAAYQLLYEAASFGSPDAKALIAWAELFGNHLAQNMEAAKQSFEQLAEIGHPDGHMGLGFLYAAGLVVNVSQPRALVHYTLSAIAGNSFAEMAVGYRYWSGVTVPPSCEKALDFYRRVANKVGKIISFGGGPAVHRIRLLDELESEITSIIVESDVLEYYRLMAEKGDVQAQVGLGQLYYLGGRGVELDYQKAMRYFTHAANSENAVAMAFLGKIYLDGSDEVKQDNETAFKYFQKAADQGNPVGQSGLGFMYLYGYGVEKNYAKALKYFSAAASQGWVDGQLQLGNMFFYGLGVKKDYRLANKHYTLASQSGNVLAFYNLAHMHATGTGMMRSCPTAVELFKNVAERGKWGENIMHAHSDYREGKFNEAFVQYAFLSELGYEVAQSNTAFMLDRGEVPMLNRQESLVRALMYWSRAASQGYANAQVKLGDYHYYGLGTAVDYETAASHYRSASEQHAQAMFNLGYMHEQGLGMAKDIHLAKRCYDLAAEASNEAKVPVALALFKLSLMFSLQNMQEYLSNLQNPLSILNLSETLGSNWDLYLITILSGALGFIVYFRRPRPNGQAAAHW